VWKGYDDKLNLDEMRYYPTICIDETEHDYPEDRVAAGG
jgi:hypothetical protein